MADTDALLHDVLARLSALERRNDELEERNDRLGRDNALLKQQSAALLAEVTQRTSVSASAGNEPLNLATTSALEHMSRRWILRRGAQMAAASVAAGVLLQRDASTARADLAEFDRIRANEVTIRPPVAEAWALYAETTNGTATISAKNLGTGPGLSAESAGANAAIEGKSNNANGWGVSGVGRNGVVGSSSHGAGNGVFGTNPVNVGVLGEGRVGVKGTSATNNFTGVVGEHTGAVGYGVLGVGKGSGVGVLGRIADAQGVGVKGESTHYVGVWGEGPTGVWGKTYVPDYAGVYGETTANGIGVYGQAPSGDGVKGVCVGGSGVRGEGRNGVYAKATNPAGYAAILDGGKAQLRLVPKTTAGKPTSGTHQRGEVYMDSTGTIFICTAAGTPGTWRRVNTSEV